MDTATNWSSVMCEIIDDGEGPAASTSKLRTPSKTRRLVSFLRMLLGKFAANQSMTWVAVSRLG